MQLLLLYMTCISDKTYGKVLGHDVWYTLYVCTHIYEPIHMNLYVREDWGTLRLHRMFVNGCLIIPLGLENYFFKKNFSNPSGIL